MKQPSSKQIQEVVEYRRHYFKQLGFVDKYEQNCLKFIKEVDLHLSTETNQEVSDKLLENRNTVLNHIVEMRAKLQEMKSHLSTLVHIPNKSERKLIRQQKAKHKN